MIYDVKTGGKTMNCIIRNMVRNASQRKPNLWNLWVKMAVIPHEVLITIWNNGIKFCTNPPNKGLKMEIFIKLLWKLYFSLPEGEYRNAVYNLYYDTVNAELVPNFKKQRKLQKHFNRIKATAQTYKR